MDIFSNLIDNEQLPSKYKELVNAYYIQRRCNYKEVREVLRISERTYYRRKKELSIIIKRVWQETQE